MLDRVVEQRERAQAEEVHLEQADALDLLHRPLRGDFAFVLLAAVERHELGERPRRDHDAGGVHRGVTRHALEAPRDVAAAPARAGRPSRGRRAAGLSLSALSSVMSSVVRDQLGDPVDFGDRHLHDAADVADHGRRLHGAERDDLRDVLAAVFLGDVRDDLPAAPLAEVDVDIRQRHALGVEEALEVQVEVQRIDVGDPQAVGDQAAGRRPAARARPECPARARTG